MTIGVVGATGLVGSKMIEILQERSFPADDFLAFASNRCPNRYVTIKDRTYPIEIINPEALGQGVILLGATSAEIARTWIPDCVRNGVIIIDNSSAYRMEQDVPLIVPEVNPQTIDRHKGIISNPNCSTIQLVIALAPLMKISPIKWLSVSTYQAVSGAGSGALIKLSAEQENKAQVFDTQFHENILTEIDPPRENGYCGEERKLMLETLKILETNFFVYPSCARVPVRTGHTEAVTVKFRNPVSAAIASRILSEAPGVIVRDMGITPRLMENTDEVAVSRLRNYPSDMSILQFWVTADNIRKGAALNAVQIAELLIVK